MGLVTSATYLTVAFALPAWFMLKLCKASAAGCACRPAGLCACHPARSALSRSSGGTAPARCPLALQVNAFEHALLWSLIPISIILSVIGFWASVVALESDLGGGEGWGAQWQGAASGLTALFSASP